MLFFKNNNGRGASAISTPGCITAGRRSLGEKERLPKQWGFAGIFIAGVLYNIQYTVTSVERYQDWKWDHFVRKRSRLRAFLLFEKRD